MSKSGYSRSGLFGTINHYDSHGHDTASYARVYQTRAEKTAARLAVRE